jgi:hypothetical protein
MDTPQEQAKQPTAKPLFEKIANGNRDVYCALWSFWNFAHAWDDLLDGSNWPAPQKERAMKALHDFIVNLLLNPFCRDNAGDLRAVFVSAMARSMDGDAMAESNDPKRRALAPAVRCGDVDVILHMAYLAGGWELLREIGPLRDYDPEDPKPKD